MNSLATQQPLFFTTESIEILKNLMKFSNFTWDIEKKIYRLHYLEMSKGLLTFLPQYSLSTLAKKEREGRRSEEKAKRGRREVTGEERDTNITHLY